MLRTLGLVLLIALFAVGCEGDDEVATSTTVTPFPSIETETVTDAETATETETETVIVTETATESGTETVTESETEFETETETEIASVTETEPTTDSATDSATGSDTQFAAGDDVVCFGLQAVLDGYEDFVQADPDSDQQREAVELIGQFADEVADVIGADSPELEEALDTLRDNAADIVSEGQSAAEESEVQEALEVIEQEEANCAG